MEITRGVIPKAPVHIFHPDTGALMGILMPCILKEAGHGR